MLTFLILNAVLGALGSEVTPSGTAQHLQDLHCPPCERIHCPSRRLQRLHCKGGITTGICGCCPACARTDGESCGGSWDYLGKCDEGLVCVQQDGTPDGARQGICKAVMQPLEAQSCRPDCTREYCQANPTEICSARSSSLEEQSCHGSCQHTSCSACLLLTPPSCPQSCAPTNTSCLHHFGRCVHNHLSAPRSPVCHRSLQSNPDGHFRCLLPACPNTLK
ncbi:uncharacterized protein LOC142990146 [Genypterus blacodes]|uniref:uncharacterized protein LOC142990146 n=1 Tax=Genypterus blacodes TaxID=154954 RepID=UPI003F76C484